MPNKNPYPLIADIIMSYQSKDSMEKVNENNWKTIESPLGYYFRGWHNSICRNFNLIGTPSIPHAAVNRNGLDKPLQCFTLCLIFCFPL